MPHIIIMHTGAKALDMPELLGDLHRALAADDSVNISQIKTYDLPVGRAIVGDDARPDHMMHIQVRMKPGRSEEKRMHIARTLHDVARTCADDAGYQCAVSVEMHELHEPSYQSSYSDKE